jgi:hypothetical protein
MFCASPWSHPSNLLASSERNSHVYCTTALPGISNLCRRLSKTVTRLEMFPPYSLSKTALRVVLWGVGGRRVGGGLACVPAREAPHSESPRWPQLGRAGGPRALRGNRRCVALCPLPTCASLLQPKFRHRAAPPVTARRARLTVPAGTCQCNRDLPGRRTSTTGLGRGPLRHLGGGLGV